MSENPYETPSAEIEQTPLGDYKLSGINSMPFARGATWVTESFNFFKKFPIQWIVTGFLWLLFIMLMSIIPFIGFLGLLITAFVWTGGMMYGCRQQDEGKDFSVSYLFSGFSVQTGNLILLSVISTIISIVITMVSLGSLMFAVMSGDSSSLTNPLELALALLIYAALMIPFAMAFWFSPLLIVLHGMPVVEAIKQSFVGCLKNFIPFLLYGIVMFILLIILSATAFLGLISIIPIFIGMLVFIPVVIISMYVAYKDIYLESNEHLEP